MKKIIEYRICYDNFYESLAEEVNKLLAKGWQPFGGICVDSLGVRVLQAMVKYEE